jgi:hypothetical protein
LVGLSSQINYICRKKVAASQSFEVPIRII